MGGCALCVYFHALGGFNSMDLMTFFTPIHSSCAIREKMKAIKCELVAEHSLKYKVSMLYDK